MKNENNTIMPENNPVILFQGSLRDYFAGQALASLIVCNKGRSGSDEELDASISKWSYETADAMLAAREGVK